MQAITRCVKDHALKDRMNENREEEEARQGKYLMASGTIETLGNLFHFTKENPNA